MNWTSELERRGHRFVRYADDCNIYVRSLKRPAERVMQSVTRFIERRLKLQVNAAKSAVDRPWRRSFLGFTLRNEPELRRRIAAKAVARFKHRVRELTRRHRGVSLERMIRELAPLPSGMGRLLRLQPVAASCRRSKAGSDDACVASSGSSGRRAAGRHKELRRLNVPERLASEATPRRKGSLAAAASAKPCMAASPEARSTSTCGGRP